MGVNETSRPLDPGAFVEIVYRDVFQSAVDDSIGAFESPPGRRPTQELMELHDWYVSQSDDSKQMIRRAMSFAADSSVFGILCLLDNVRPVTPGYRETLALKVHSAGEERDLSAEGVELHSLFRGRVDSDPI